MIYWRARLVTMDETWLYHYDPETKDNQWSGDIAVHTAPKIPSAKIGCRSSRLDFLGLRRHPPHWLSSKGPNYQRGILLISAGATDGHFERKTPREVHQGRLVLARQSSGSTGTCNPQETGLPGLPMSWSPTLFSWSGPVRLPSVPWIEKQLKDRHFSSDAEVIAAAETWFDRQLSEFVFKWLAKVRATG